MEFNIKTQRNRSNCLFLLTCIIFFFLATTTSYGQNQQITLSKSNTTVKEVFREIEKQIGFSVDFDEATIDVNRKINIPTSNKKLDDILNLVLKDATCDYSIKGKHILITAKKIQGQLVQVIGTVSDQNGELIIGANVMEKGTTNGNITDADGKFSLKMPVKSVLSVSYIGYVTKEILIEKQSELKVVLVENSETLEEVVVIGYGTMRKSDLTGSVSKVGSENVAERAITSVEQMLQGQASGVQITQNSGAAGGGISFSIRGSNSVTGSNQPLVVIDGYPVDSSNGDTKVSQGGESTYVGDLPQDNALSNLNPGDIESIEILKDASSTSIFGSRGANGVVMITTKRGKEGRDKIEYNFRLDASSIPKKIDVLNTKDYIDYSNEGYLNGQQDSIYNAAKIEELLGNDTNWQDLVFRTGISHNHQFNISGGDRKMKYAVALGYLNQEGVVKNSNFNRGTLRINLDREIGKKFKFGINASGVMSKNKAVMQATSNGALSGSVVLGALKSAPTQQAYTSDDELDVTYQGNPLTLINKSDDQNRVTTVLANLFASYTLIDGLVLKINGGVNNVSSMREFYHPRGTYLGDQNNGYAFRAHGNSFNYLLEYTASYNKTFYKKHRINAVAGYTWQNWMSRNYGMGVRNFPNDNMKYFDLSSGNTLDKPKSSTTESALASYLARINYVYDNRYLVTLTGRSDGSTRLAPGNKWNFFPSGALGWNMHNEHFMESLDFISELKLRASYGISGNQAIGIGATQSRLSTVSTVINQSIQTAYIQANMANGLLGWENTKQTNAGLDLALFNSRIRFGFEYYAKQTNDLLINLPLPASSGFSSYATNQGCVQNKGYEFDLSARILTKTFQWDLAGNISFNKNKIINLGNLESFIGPTFGLVAGQPMHIAKVGYPIGSFYGYRVEGIYQNQAEVDNGPVDPSNPAPGSFKFKDISGPDGKPDGLISTDDREIIGNPYPDFIFGLTNNFSWKGFSLSVFIQGSIGQDVINANRFTMDALCRGGSSNVRKEAWENRWQGEGTSNTYPQAITGKTPFSDRFSDFIVENASFIRLKSVTLSYDVPEKTIPFVRNLKLFVSGTNLLTLTDYKGYDPEVSSRGDNSLTPGVDGGSIPQYRTFSFGLNIGF